MTKNITICMVLFLLALQKPIQCQAQIFGYETLKTSIRKGRFETFTPVECSDFTFVLDKYTGNVWYYQKENGTAEWKQIYRCFTNKNKQMLYTVLDEKEADHNRYQLMSVKDDVEEFYLKDLDTDLLWALRNDKNHGLIFLYMSGDQKNNLKFVD